MEIHLARDGSPLGIFTEAEVREGLAAGTFRGSDLAWRQGMETWTPLAEWPDFAGVAGTAPPTAATASEIPWEQTRGLGSLFRTLGLALTGSRKLGTGRFEEGSSFGLAYAAMGLGFLPIVAVAALSSAAQPGQVEAFRDLLEGMEGPLAEGIRSSLDETDATPALMSVLLAGCGALLLPLINAAVGIVEWVGLRATGAKVPFGRSVMASMTLHTLVSVGLLPLALVTGSLSLAFPLVGLGGDGLAILVSLVLLALGLGHALGLNPWRIVLAWVVVLLAVTCCLCGCGGIAGAIAGMAG
jgi:hypothetical protein